MSTPSTCWSLHTGRHAASISTSATGDSISALEMLQKIANAGKSRFLLSDGPATVNREGLSPRTGVITPHEMVEELQSGFTVPSDDDFDGVDVTYINGTTWAEETVKCRTPDNPTPVKIEAYKLDGVLNQDHAYQIGMRRLMKYLQQRVTFQTTTELDALCYNTGDRIVLTDDIPGNNTISLSGGGDDNGWWRDNVHRYGAAGLVFRKSPGADPISGWLCIRADGGEQGG